MNKTTEKRNKIRDARGMEEQEWSEVYEESGIVIKEKAAER